MPPTPLERIYEVIAPYVERFPLLTSVLILLVGSWVVTYPAGWFLRRQLKSKREILDRQKADRGDDQIGEDLSRGFTDGGVVIGRLERLLIFLFVIAGELGAVGFLITAKSVFRFGELTNKENRLEAEYIIIGTLMSFTVGLVISWGFKSLITTII